MKKVLLNTCQILVCTLMLLSCLGKEKKELNLIPQPQKMQEGLSWGIDIVNDDKICPINFDQSLAQADIDNLCFLLEKDLKKQEPNLKVIASKQSLFSIRLNDTIKGFDGYKLRSTTDMLLLEARDIKGLRQGVQTILQLIDRSYSIPQVNIEDSARFAYRGVMLDVSRHFFDKNYILRLLDEMARYKLNTFHWHLVDGGGWRLQIDAFPKLIEKACYRTEADWQKFWTEKDRGFVTADYKGAYGGYYTKDDVREVVAYAGKLGITVIPEIELPGHSNELLFAYPELFCSSVNPEEFIEVSDVCIGKEEVFNFYEKVLDEVMELFPSEYIHIGGDEARKNTWANCSDCQKRMKQNKLADLNELQSYMIKRIEKYLKSKGRKLIGWDEILEGGLAEDATVMSWRGEKGGIAAANAGHHVIMTPNSHLYLDYYQSYGKTEPRAIGGFLPLSKVYSYNPIPQDIAEDKRGLILGVQANLWTEYVGDNAHADYMFFPRLLALAEVAWTKPERKDFNKFLKRASIHNEALQKRGFNCYKMGSINAELTFDKKNSSAVVALKSELQPTKIHYTLDGSTPSMESPIYTEPLETTDSLTIKAITFKNGKALSSDPLEYRVDLHKAMGKKITYNNPYNSYYPANGELTLLDGVRGTPTYLDGKWQGFTRNLDVTIDLEEVMPLSHIFTKFMQESEQWVYMPMDVEVAISQDGTHFETLDILKPKTPVDNPRPLFETFDFYTKKSARYINVKATVRPHKWIFIDEIVVW